MKMTAMVTLLSVSKMTSKTKTLLKVGIPLVIVIQLTSIIFLLGRAGRHKAFSCKTAREYLVCRQVELK